MRVIRNTERDQ